MKFKSLVLAAAITAVLSGCERQAETTEHNTGVPLESQEAKISYILGTNIGSQFKSEEINIDEQALLAGITDAIAGNTPRMDQEEIVAVLQSFQDQQVARQEESMKVKAEANLLEGQQFLSENATKEGVVTLESGLQYKVIESGEGNSPAVDDIVQVHYRGTLIDGSEFDSSFKRGVPAEFGVNQVIPGWTEALQLMKEGAKWELYIPSELAYGPGGTGGPIGPNQTLLFEVALLKILPAEKEAE